MSRTMSPTLAKAKRRRSHLSELAESLISRDDGFLWTRRTDDDGDTYLSRLTVEATDLSDERTHTFPFAGEATGACIACQAGTCVQEVRRYQGGGEQVIHGQGPELN